MVMNLRTLLYIKQRPYEVKFKHNIEHINVARYVRRRHIGVFSKIYVNL